MAKQAPESAPTSPVILRDRFMIDPSKPLPDLRMPQADAFECEDKKGAGRPLYALVCRPDMPVRVGAMRSLKGVQTQGHLQLVEYGTIEWGNRRVMAVVYERPMGGRLVIGANGKLDPIPESQIVRKVIKPLLSALTEFSSRGVSHRAIRPDNLYWFDQSKDRLVLGDCATSLPGYDNPPVYEPLEFAMAIPEGRGQGYAQDDLYALGLTVLSLIVGRDVSTGWTTEQVVKAKLAQSTYATFCANEKVPLNFLEVMRGLLCDDRKDRWKLEDLDMWMNGRRMPPIQPKPPRRAQRGLKFEGVEYFSAAELAHAFASKWDAAVPFITGGQLEVWLRRGLEDNDTADAIALAIRLSQAVQGDARQVADFTMARVLMLLDPAAPLRYRDVRVTLEGFGGALAVAVMQRKQLRPYMEIIVRDLPRHWIQAQGMYSPELSHLEIQFKDLSGNLNTTMIGWGIERCLYELNEHLHCQSPLIEAEYVTDIRELLPALDKVAGKVDDKARPVDRHIAAFIGVKWQRDTKVQFRALNDPSEERSALGMVSLLAILQWRLGPPVLSGLTAWVGGLLGPIVNSYSSRTRRRELESEIPKLVRKGNLPELYNLLDDQEERQKDAEGFAWARAEYSAAAQQLKALESGKLIRDEQAEMLGQQAAAAISVVIAIITMTGLLFGRIF